MGGRERPTVSPEDLTQDVLVSLITALPRYRRAEGPFVGFVYGIAAHKVANAFRTLGRDRTAAISDVPDLLETAECTSGPEEQVLDAWGRERMDLLLEQLPDRQREILVLRAVVGLSAEEVAVAVRSTPGAVRIAQHRALTRLRGLLAVDVRARRSAGRPSLTGARTPG